jgi:hypothetical protein
VNIEAPDAKTGKASGTGGTSTASAAEVRKTGAFTDDTASSSFCEPSLGR